ncbi:EamA-like transporter family protein [Flavobacterium resistens]|uniref:EamA family transporter n=1 Tax=Flavobacterium resistens TaxID=443612 RepID=A0A521F1T8_9FLAO|nr:DMT family transporter [Flavobacterium resistens]MRX69354.1 EamA family transporter [Flavobacterium resistens]SMO89420.1 EamA-like transporter family protein [Flavobacterium resistens]
MLFLVLSILCSVTVGVIFKITRKYNTNAIQIITFNYVTALLLCYFTFSPNIIEVHADAPWNIYAAVGVLLPIVFLFLFFSIKHMGIVKTDAAQRLSLFIPIIAAWLIFKEEFNSYKVIGLVIGFVALLFILKKQSGNNENKWIYPAVVFLGFGIIDILFKQIALYTALPYTTSLFMVFDIALAVSLLIVIYDVVLKKEKLQAKNILFGALVGMFNFGNILFYLKAHKAFAENPSTVFAGMNMGVIILGSLVGLLFFKEKLSKINFIGIFLALIAIIFIVFSQLN